jgi:hypothetical protein
VFVLLREASDFDGRVALFPSWLWPCIFSCGI